MIILERGLMEYSQPKKIFNFTLFFKHQFTNMQEVDQSLISTHFTRNEDGGRGRCHMFEFRRLDPGTHLDGYISITQIPTYTKVAILSINDAYISGQTLKDFISRCCSSGEIELELSNCTVYNELNNTRPPLDCYKSVKSLKCVLDGSKSINELQINFLKWNSSILEIDLGIKTCLPDVFYRMMYDVFRNRTVKRVDIKILTPIKDAPKATYDKWDRMANVISLNKSVTEFVISNETIAIYCLTSWVVNQLIRNKTITTLKIKNFLWFGDTEFFAPFIGLLQNASLRSLTLKPHIVDFYEQPDSYFEQFQNTILKHVLLNTTLNNFKYYIDTNGRSTTRFRNVVSRFVKESDYKEVPYRNTNYHLLCIFKHLNMDNLCFHDKLFDNKYGTTTDQQRIISLGHARTAKNTNSGAHNVPSVILRKIAEMLVSEPMKLGHKVSNVEQFDRWREEHGVQGTENSSMHFFISGSKLFPSCLRHVETVQFQVGNMADLRMFKGYVTQNGIDEKNIYVLYADTFINNKWREALKGVEPLPTNVRFDKVYLCLQIRF